MLLEGLVGCIELLQERARSYRDALEKNETRTRVVLIDPLLRALGWDVSDPGLVIPEHKVGSGLADYALLGPDGKPAAVVEAKKLGEQLKDSHREQMVGYSVQSGIAYAGLTNGDRWELYDVFQPSPLKEKRLLDVSIANDPAYESALGLLLLWRPNAASGQKPVPAAEPVLGAASRPAPDPVDDEQDLAPPPGSPGWVALSEYEPPARTPCPAAIRFWDGSEQSLKAWRQMLIGIADKLAEEGLLTAEGAPVLIAHSVIRTQSRCIVNAEPAQPDGRPFRAPYRLAGGTLFLDSHASARRARHWTRGLLRHCGLDPANVHLRIAQ